MKAFYRYLWIFSLAQIFSVISISCFNVPNPSSVHGVPNYWSGANICAATVFLWSLTLGCTSNSHRLPEMLATKNKEGKGIRHMKTMKYKNSKNGANKKTNRQGSADVTGDIPNEIVIIEDLRSHLISKLGVLDPMMCLPKALCGLSSASTASPNSSSELVKDYLHHMKAVILTRTTTTTPTPAVTVTQKGNATNNLELSQNEENLDDEDSESEDTEEDEEDEEDEDTSEEEEEEENQANKYYDNYNKYRTESFEDDDTEDDDSIPTESDEQLLRDYLTDKTEVTQYLDEENFDDVPSWWDNVPTKDMTIPLSPISDWASTLTSYIPTGMTSWLTSALPSFSWDFGPDSRKEGIFEKDPFFTTFRSGGRSLSDSSTTSTTHGSDNLKDKQLSSDLKANLKKRKKILKQYRKLKKKIKRRQERKLKHRDKPPPSSMKKLLKKIKRMNKLGNATKVILSKRIIQQDLLDGVDKELSEIENPMARLQTAVEIGKKLDDPRKCNILFSACPWKYDEVLEIIEDSHRSVKGSSSEVKKKTATKKVKGGKGSAMEKLKQSLKANSKNSSMIDLPDETVVKHPLPGGGHLEVKFSHSAESNKVKQNPPKTKKISSSLLKPFQETKYLGVKTENKKKKQKKPIEYKYPKYNYRVSFPNTDHKSIIISQYEEITTKRPQQKKIRQSTTTTTEAPEEEEEEEPTTTTKKTNPDINDINVEDSGENIIIRIPKEKNPADTYTRNPLLFNPFRIYSSQYPSYSNQQPQPYPAPAPAPTLIPAPQYYNQYYQPQYQLQPVQPQPQLQPSPWYYYNPNHRNNYQIKRAWQPTRNPYYKTNIN